MIKTLAIATLLVLGACQSMSKEETLRALQSKLAEKQAEIVELTRAIAALSSDSLLAEAYVTTYTARAEPFRHEIEIRGSVRSERNLLISAQTQGRIVRLPVKEGALVAKGDLLVQLDDVILQNNLAEIDNELSLASLNYQRQKNLWDNNIGTEFQYLQAESTFEGLQRRRETLLTQLAYTRVRAPFAGRCEEVTAKLGELATPGRPLLRLFDPNNLHVAADLPDSYVNSIQVGNPVRIHVLGTEEVFESSLRYVGKVVNVDNRTVLVRASLPDSANLLANQVVKLFIEDYRSESNVVVLTELIHRDSKGSYVFALNQAENNQYIVQKNYLNLGQQYGQQSEVLSGLNSQVLLVHQGNRIVQDSMRVQVASKTLAN